MENAVLFGATLARFETLQSVLVPRFRKFSGQQKEESRRLINAVLSDRPKEALKKIRLFLSLVYCLSLMTGLKTFRNLCAVKQTCVLNRLFDSRLALLRKGFWGINTLAKLGVYGQTSVYAEIGYVKREPR